MKTKTQKVKKEKLKYLKINQNDSIKNILESTDQIDCSDSEENDSADSDREVRFFLNNITIDLT
jgi:hypothetical protein